MQRVPGGAAVASLSRRLRTLIIAAVLFLVLFMLAVTMPVPYVMLSPGPTYNTLGTYDRGRPIIVIKGRAAHVRDGHLNLTTVGVGRPTMTAFQAIAGWLAGDRVVVPSSAVYPPGESEQQTNRTNTQDFIASQDSATAAALCELKYPRGFGIVKVTVNGPSAHVLRPGDFFVSIAGHPTTNQESLQSVLRTQRPGNTVPVVVKRAGKLTTLPVTLGKPASGQQGARLGVYVATGCLAPFTVDLGLANEIGGPSAGLMFALGIMDKVGPTDLTKGRFIAGTGTINPQGNVGPIGGIALKMIAARDKGATVFLAPAGNCGDVRNATPSGLKVVKVTTLHGAVQDLLRLQHGKSVPGC